MSLQPRTYRQLQPEDRVTLASLKQQNYSVREIADVLGRLASTISRELRRNASTVQYSSMSAQQSCQHRRRQGRPMRDLHPDAILFDVVQHLLRQRWAPEQIALTLARINPKGHELRVSHETIYNCIYAQPVGELQGPDRLPAPRPQQARATQQGPGPTWPDPRHVQCVFHAMPDTIPC